MFKLQNNPNDTGEGYIARYYSLSANATTMNAKLITGTPQNDYDCANKSYVDTSFTLNYTNIGDSENKNILAPVEDFPYDS